MKKLEIQKFNKKFKAIQKTLKAAKKLPSKERDETFAAGCLGIFKLIRDTLIPVLAKQAGAKQAGRKRTKNKQECKSKTVTIN